MNYESKIQSFTALYFNIASYSEFLSLNWEEFLNQKGRLQRSLQAKGHTKYMNCPVGPHISL